MNMRKSTFWKISTIFWGCATLIALVMWLIAPAYAQSRYGGVAGDLNNFFDSFKTLAGGISLVVAAAILGLYTYTYKPKDSYEVAWLAIAWCALAYVVR
jgi:hypothetical protein